jgi:phosphonate transport system substrate-binding protein
VYDIATAGALQYLEVSDIYEPLVKTVRNDQEFYFGIIFVRDGAGIRSLSDLKGKRVAFASERSTSGYLLPLLKLLDAGLGTGDYQRILAGGHDKVAKLVMSGEADAGACFEDCRTLYLPDIQEREKQTTVLSFTQKIPADPILIRKSLPAATKNALRDALLRVGLETDILQGLPAAAEITGFAKAEPADYAIIRKALDQVGKM